MRVLPKGQADPYGGCHGAQIPFINWLGSVPMAGSSLQKVVGSAARPVTPLLFGTSGRQFFLADAGDGVEPVLVSNTYLGGAFRIPRQYDRRTASLGRSSDGQLAAQGHKPCSMQIASKKLNT